MTTTATENTPAEAAASASTPAPRMPESPIEFLQSLTPRFAQRYSQLSDFHTISAPASDPKVFGAKPTVDFENLLTVCNAYNNREADTMRQIKPALDATMQEIELNPNYGQKDLHDQRVAHGKVSYLLSAINTKKVKDLSTLRAAMEKRMKALQPSYEEVTNQRITAAEAQAAEAKRQAEEAQRKLLEQAVASAAETKRQAEASASAAIETQRKLVEGMEESQRKMTEAFAESQRKLMEALAESQTKLSEALAPIKGDTPTGPGTTGTGKTETKGTKKAAPGASTSRFPTVNKFGKFLESSISKMGKGFLRLITLGRYGRSTQKTVDVTAAPTQ